MNHTATAGQLWMLSGLASLMGVLLGIWFGVLLKSCMDVSYKLKIHEIVVSAFCVVMAAIVFILVFAIAVMNGWVVGS